MTDESLLDLDGNRYQGGQLLHNLLLFGRLCKALGMSVTPDAMIQVARALEFIQLENKTDFYHTLRAVIVTRQRDLELFDQAFAMFWRKPGKQWLTHDLKPTGDRRYQRKMQFLAPPGMTPGDEQGAPPAAPDSTLIALIPTYSQQEILRHKDFSEMTGPELAVAERMMARLPRSLGYRRTRRFQSGPGAPVDLRRTLRRNMRYMGEILVLPGRVRKQKPRPLVLICDISGSMERYTRIFLHFMHTFAQSMYQVESFVFGTRLTRITHPIRYKSVDRALHEVGRSVGDWGGGTKMGQALHEFNLRWSRRVLGQGAIVLLITDGWDRGEPEVLMREADRLQRSCHRLIWLNPLLAAPLYEPLTRGAQALLPYADDFLPIANLANLEMIITELQKIEGRRPGLAAHSQLRK